MNVENPGANSDVLKARVVKMGARALNMAVDATYSLTHADRAPAAKVLQAEQDVNQMDIDHEIESVALLTNQNRDADTVRRILVAMRVNTELERVADHATNIARRALEGAKLENQPLADMLWEMVGLSSRMLGGALASLDQETSLHATNIIEEDREINALRDSLKKKVQMLLERKQLRPDSAITAILTAEDIERMGDHATNIAEEVIFLTRGVVVKHHYKIERERLPMSVQLSK